jgi:hypothetical protein
MQYSCFLYYDKNFEIFKLHVRFIFFFLFTYFFIRNLHLFYAYDLIGIVIVLWGDFFIVNYVELNKFIKEIYLGFLTLFTVFIEGLRPDPLNSDFDRLFRGYFNLFIVIFGFLLLYYIVVII